MTPAQPAPLPFRASSRTYAFPTGLIRGNGELSFTSDDLVHALATTGRAPGDRARHGMASAFEFIHRVSVIPAYIRRNYHGRLVRSRLALELDRSEMGGFSYSLGQAMTGIFCRDQLTVSHLMHVDRYANQYGLTFAGRKRADLFGLSTHGWVVAEAKGRSRRMEAVLQAQLKAQKRSVLTVLGASPSIAVGCVASFPHRRGGIEIDSFDPTEAEPEALEIPGSADDYFLAYYLPLLAIVDRGTSAPAERIGREDLIVGEFSGLGVRFGMIQSLYERVRQAVTDNQASGLGSAQTLSQDVQSILDSVQPGERGLFPDGTIVRTDWAEALSVQDWFEESAF